MQDDMTTLESAVTYLRRGKTPKYAEQGSVLIINQKCVRWNGIDTNQARFLDDGERTTWSEERYLQHGDVLINSTGEGTIGRAAVWEFDDGKFVADSHVTVVRANRVKLEPWWLRYWVESSDGQAFVTESKTGGTKQTELGAAKLRQAKIPLPHIDEQRRIVARIKACMERIDEIEGLRKEASKEAGALRSAIAHNAWEELKTRYGLTPLRNFISSAKNGLYKPKEFHGTGAVLLRMFNVVSGSMKLERIERLEVTNEELEKYSICEGDILVSRVNSRELVGKSAAVSGLDEPAVFEAMLIRLRVKSGLDSYALSQLMNAPQFLQDIRNRAKHAIGQSSINQDDLLDTLLPNVPPKELSRLGQQWREMLSVAGQLDIETDRPDEAAQMRAAVLRKAFAGEL